jgi:hypothetical protein
VAFMVEAIMSSEKVTWTWAKGATPLAPLLGSELMTVGGVVSGVTYVLKAKSWSPLGRQPLPEDTKALPPE